MFPDRFQTARLMLRPVALSDALAIFNGYARDPAVSRFVTWRPHRTIDDTNAYLSAAAGVAIPRNYAIVSADGGPCIGTFELRRPAPARIAYGYVLARPFWGQGFMTELLTEVSDWAMRQPEIWRIGDVCDVDNVASARVMEKSGLTREGVLRRWMVAPNISDEPRDCFSYARTR